MVCNSFFCTITSIPQSLEIIFILLGFLSLLFIVQLFYYLFTFNLFAFSAEDKEAKGTVTESASIIICARNEEENLRNNLPAILAQEHKDFEVVVVNDCSYDDTENLLKGLSEKHKHLKIVEVKASEHFRHGKKFALTMGIKAAKSELLIFTDADCIPASPHWLAGMATKFSPETQIVLGYSQYKSYFGVLNRFIRFETFFSALQYLSFSLKGKTYMGVGRNLAYRKSLFFESKGFASHLHIMAGDDDLFVNQNATKTNTRIQVTKDTLVLSEPKRTFSSYVVQKLRHQSVGKYYKSEHKWMLSIFGLSSILFYALFITLLALQIMPEVVLGIFVARLLVQLIVFRQAMKKLSCLDLWWQTPLLDIMYSFFMLLIAPIGTFRKLKRWK